jgi:beta-N-acetylhexosaminidase
MRAEFIAALSGLSLTAAEAALLRAARPCGVILFARNIRDPGQVRALTDAVRAALGREDALLAIDQEGGRVQRLRPPHWRALPPAATFGRLYERDRWTALRAARLTARLIAADLRAVGINTNCAPVLDVPVPGSHAVIGDRAYGAVPAVVAELGRVFAEGLLAGGVLPIMKHIPGHGRAMADSHRARPVVTSARNVLEESDFLPFHALKDMPAAMTAHVVFTAIDPDAPASTSARVTREVIRGAIGFAGLLVSDDLGMSALAGSMAARAKAVVAAGTDVALCCSADTAVTESVAAALGPLQGRAAERFAHASAVFQQQRPFDVAEAEACLAAALGPVG